MLPSLRSLSVKRVRQVCFAHSAWLRCFSLGVVVLVLLSACSPINGAQQPQNSSPQNSLPQNGPPLRIGSSKPFENTLLVKSQWPSTRLMAAVVHRGLVAEDADGNLLPMLAETVPTFENGGAEFVTQAASGDEQLMVTFRLRPDLTWSDGRPLTSADVVFTHELLSQNYWIGYPREQAIERIETPDAQTVQIFYPPGFTSPLYNQVFADAIYPEHLLKNLDLSQISAGLYALRPVGTGPYQVREWRYVGEERATPLPGVLTQPASEETSIVQEITLEPNPAYVGEPPRLQEIIFIVFSDETKLIDALQQGEIDMIADHTLNELAADTTQELQEDFVIEDGPGQRWARLDMNMREESPLQDEQLRQALAYAIDRQDLVEMVLRGQGQVLQSWLPPEHWATEPVLEQYQYNPEEARELIEQAGYTYDSGGFATRDGQRLMLRLIVADGDPVRERVATHIVDDLGNVGITVEQELLDPAFLLGPSGMLIEGNFELALYSWQGDVGKDSLQLWHSQFVPTADNDWEGNNFSGWVDTENDAALDGINTIGSEAERQAYYQTQQQLFAEALPSLPLFTHPHFVVHDPGIQGIQLPVGTRPSSWNIEEWSWE